MQCVALFVLFCFTSIASPFIFNRLGKTKFSFDCISFCFFFVFYVTLTLTIDVDDEVSLLQRGTGVTNDPLLNFNIIFSSKAGILGDEFGL